jgi:hypothetical protein
MLLRKNCCERSIKISAVFMEVPQLTEAQLVPGQEELQLLKHEKQSSMLCLALSVQSQLLHLRCRIVLILSCTRIDIQDMAEIVNSL